MVIDLSAISYSYGSTEAVDDVTLGADHGEVVGLVGPNGAGKTTLLRVAMGLLTPDGGRARVFGEAPRQIGVQRRVGYVPEVSLLPPQLQVGEVLSMHRSLYPTWDRNLERDLVARGNLDPSRRVVELSKGQRRWITLVCAMSYRPELLILDEPAGGLDPAARREFLETAIARLADDGTTVLFSSHHMTDVERIASRVAIMLEGRLVIDRPVAELGNEYCLVVLPPQPTADLEALEDCLSVRRVSGAVHVLSLGSPAAAARVFGPEARIRRLSLEDLFVELAAGTTQHSILSATAAAPLPSGGWSPPRWIRAIALVLLFPIGHFRRRRDRR